MNIESLRAALVIQQHALDEDISRQPELFEQVARQYALAISRRDAAKDNLKSETGRLYAQEREHLEEEGGKVTEAQVSSALDRNDEMQRLRRSVLAATEEADLWQALKEAWVQRSYALKDLASLYVSRMRETDAVRSTASKREVEEHEYERRREALAKDRRSLVKDIKKARQDKAAPARRKLEV